MASASGRLGASLRRPPGPLTIYSSLPLGGADAGVSRSAEDAELLASEQAHGRAGRFVLRLVILDSSSPDTGDLDSADARQNALQAAADPSTIAYLADTAPGVSAVSTPLLRPTELGQPGGSQEIAACWLTSRTGATPVAQSSRTRRATIKGCLRKTK
jgi:hypothetical protein